MLSSNVLRREETGQDSLHSVPVLQPPGNRMSFSAVALWLWLSRVLMLCVRSASICSQQLSGTMGDQPAVNLDFCCFLLPICSLVESVCNHSISSIQANHYFDSQYTDLKTKSCLEDVRSFLKCLHPCTLLPAVNERAGCFLTLQTSAMRNLHFNCLVDVSC